MKKKIFTLMIVLTAIATGALADVEINSTNFPDDNFRTYVKKWCQKDGNDSLSDDEIAQVKEISVVSKGIRNFKGIEFFTALQILNCGYNSSLTSLDLSKNVNMRELDCSYCSLTSLTVASGAYNFKKIECYLNQLRGDKMTAFLNSLPYLMMYGQTGQLFLIDGDDANEENEQVDLGWYTSLMSMGWYTFGHVLDNWYDYASFFQLMIPSIAIDANNFPDANFRQAVKDQCDLNKDGFLSIAEMMKVKELYVNDLKIASLKGIELFTEITDLYCSENELTSLDVSKNTKLAYLYCSWNRLTSLDVSKHTNLLLLWCYANNISSLDVSKNTKLLYLDCSRNNLTSLNVTKNTELQYLWFGHNNLTSLDVTNNKKLIELVCESNNINITEMGKLVKSMPTVKGEPGYFRVFDFTDDDNVITTSQVDMAIGKNWDVIAWNGSDEIHYSGIPDGIEVNNREQITNNRYYSLDGHRLDGVPTQKGVYIHNGKKVVVK
ncbi:MAG: hypothetical protein J5506_08825 [Prevotella sp.]|nr:hypothetical protein [Prevotella sp.]